MTIWSAGFVRSVQIRSRTARPQCSRLARFVQQLAGSNVRLHLVTEGATVGHATDGPINIAAAAVWAVGRSLITEGVLA